MSENNLIDCFMEDLRLDAVIKLADILDVSHDEEHWLDDEWPNREDELRVNVLNALDKKLTTE